MKNLVQLYRGNTSAEFLNKQNNVVLNVTTEEFSGSVLMSGKNFNKIKLKGSVEGILVEPYNSHSPYDRLFLGFNFK